VCVCVCVNWQAYKTEDQSVETHQTTEVQRWKLRTDAGPRFLTSDLYHFQRTKCTQHGPRKDKCVHVCVCARTVCISYNDTLALSSGGVLGQALRHSLKPVSPAHGCCCYIGMIWPSHCSLLLHYSARGRRRGRGLQATGVNDWLNYLDAMFDKSKQWRCVE